MDITKILRLRSDSTVLPAAAVYFIPKTVFYYVKVLLVSHLRRAVSSWSDSMRLLASQIEKSLYC